MRFLFSFLLTASMALSLTACQPAEDEPMTDDTANTMSDDWVTLFDGSGFDHWRGYKQDAMPEGWVIDGDAMYASAPGAGMDVVTKDTFTSFELELEWKVEEGGNSGIMWHVDEAAGDYPWMTGPEYQLLDDAAFDDGQVSKNSAASNYDVQAPSEAVTRPAMEWNQTRIVVNGTHVEHWLNGVKVVEYEKGSEAHQAAVAQSKWTGYAAYGTTSTGHIAFQGDHGAVWFKNIRIKPLS